MYSENKGADHVRGYREADLRLHFAYAKIRFSHDAAHMQCLFATVCHERLFSLKAEVQKNNRS